jgi:hypothetical protein
LINKIFLGFFSATLAFSVFAQPDSNTQNLRDRVEQRDASRGDKITKRDLRETTRDTPGLASLPAGPKLTACPGEFAFCGSSTCKPTGKKIAVNVGGDNRTKYYPEAVCECPIITKEIAEKNGVPLEGLAAVNDGNMKGSCARSGPGRIWSLSGVETFFPMESATPKWQPGTVGYQSCPQGTKTTNCWNFDCKVNPKPVKTTTAEGQEIMVRTATCSCAINDAYFGHHTSPKSYMATGAGSHYNNPAMACNQYPVGSETGQNTWTGEVQ